ncbi:PQQ-dependent sugar dehydrogenase [Nocardioidaceae bacterium]|nr:PQQ-dependent sugar dehydrogenase [Nocardioidaceae bacterium]
MRTPRPGHPRTSSALRRRRVYAALAVATMTSTSLAACGGDDDAGADPPPASGGPTTSQAPAPSSEAPSESRGSATDGATDPTGPTEPTVVATAAAQLQAPWGLDFLPDGSALVTERDTTRVLHLVPQPGQQRYDVREVATVDQAAPEGESGLLGIAVSPSFEQDQRVFLYVSTAEDNRVLRTTFDGSSLGELEPILTGIPNGFIHDGGRLAFGPDGFLYVSTGEIGQPDLAQDRGSLGGKILRLTVDGDPAPGNPRPDSPIWTLGHRNVQGLAFDDRDRLWASEFGQDAWDELNRVEKGSNYGWPAVEGRGGEDAPEEFRDPARQWATSEASPSGLAYADGSLWMAALRGNRLWQVPVTQGGTGEPVPHLVGDFGRLRTVAVAPDGRLWVTTSNRDGRGTPADADDRILVVDTGEDS